MRNLSCIAGPHPLARKALGTGGGRGEKEKGRDGDGAREPRQAEAGGQKELGRGRQENGTGWKVVISVRLPTLTQLCSSRRVRNARDRRRV